MELKLNGFGEGLIKRQPDPKITQEEAEVIVQNAVEVVIHENEYNALVSFCVSLGEANFLRSTLLKTLNYGDPLLVADMFLEYTNGGDKELLKLRKAERTVFRRLAVVSNRGKNDNIAKYKL